MFFRKILSASGVIAPLAALAIILALSLGALDFVNFSLAAGISMSQSHSKMLHKALL